MQTLQSRFLKLLEQRANDSGLDVVVSYSYSNCGILHLMRPDTFDTVLSIPWDVQPSGVTLGWMNKNGRDALPVFPSKPNPMFAGFKAHEVGEAIDAMLDYAKAPA